MTIFQKEIEELIEYLNKFKEHYADKQIRLKQLQEFSVTADQMAEMYVPKDKRESYLSQALRAHLKINS